METLELRNSPSSLGALLHVDPPYFGLQTLYYQNATVVTGPVGDITVWATGPVTVATHVPTPGAIDAFFALMQLQNSSHQKVM